MPAKAGDDVSRLRFRNCVFTVKRGDGVTKTHDVTAVLNGMAVAYKGGYNNPQMLTLVRPLNPFSFVIPGFNDRATVADPSARPWCASPPSPCAGDADCPGAMPGSCNILAPSGNCCPAGQVCVEGTCTAASGSCSGGCPAGTLCVGGACMSPSGSCCPAGQYCVLGQCAAKPGICSTCPGGATVTLAGQWRTI
jgi:hypothetical protein